ncbi:MAG: DUF3857 domain-containing protein [Planctomycetes bacterium]|nr:DUF3857 domain-containing protein [Planctomycetota bacterium]
MQRTTRSRGLRRTLLFAAVLLPFAPPARAQLQPGESEALELKQRGDDAAAAAAFVSLCEALPADGGNAALAAAAETWVATAAVLAERSGAVELRARLRALAATPGVARHPALRDRALHGALQLSRAAGAVAELLELTRELGYLQSWQVLGPFDNERGGRFGRTDVPALCADFDAVHEGARRPVAWRRAPVDVLPGGYVDLDAMLRPNDQVLALAAVALLTAESGRTVALHLGSDEAVGVWLNGVRLLSRDVRRPFRPDQDAVALPLQAGANLLVLEIGEQEGEFGFAARVVELDGSPLLDDVTSSADRADLTRAAATAPRQDGELPAVARGALDVLAAVAGDDPLAAWRLALLLSQDRPDDDSARRDRELARRAAEALPAFLAARFLYAYTLGQEGRAEEKDENLRRRQYEQILATVPDHVEALFALAHMDWTGLRAAALAEPLLDRALRANPAHAPSLLLRAELLEDLPALTEPALARAADTTPPMPVALDTRASWLARRDRDHEAARLRERELTVGWSAAVAVASARTLLDSGNRDRAVAVLAAAERLAPFARGPRELLAGLLAAEGDLTGALRVWSDWLTICPEDDDALVAVADLYGRSGEREARLEALRAALLVDPNRKREARLLEFLEAGATPFHAPYEIDSAAVIAADPGAPADSATANDSHHWLLEQDIVRAYANGTTSVYRHRILRILNERGVERFARWSVRHAYGEQRARFLELRVIGPDGQERRPRLSGSLAQLPPLQPGDVVVVRERVDDTAPTFFGEYFGLEHRFDDDVPVRRSELVLLLDQGRTYRFQTRGGAPEPSVERLPNGIELRRYAMADLQRRPSEDRAPDADETCPLVRVTTYESWDAFASWWWNLIRRQTEVSPAMRAKVAELTAGTTDELARIAAIYRFVTTDVRYEAWEFGVHGYKPYATSVVFDRRHGDCKDKALLLDAMLGEIGVEAWPVLIHADPLRSDDDLSLAMVQHFNHCISYLPATATRPAMFLDGTATWHPVDTLPQMDQGAEVLVVRGERAELRDIAWTSPDANVELIHYAVALQRDGSGRFEMTNMPTGNEAVPLREFLATEPGLRDRNLERALGRELGEVRLEEVVGSDPESLDVPVELRVEGRASRVATVQSGALALRPTPRAATLQQLAAAPTRELPLLLGIPRTDRHVTRYELPAGFTPAGLPAPVALDAKFGRYRQSWSVDGDALVVDRELVLSAPRIEPAEYPEFREFARRVDDADRRVTLLQEKSR